MQEYRWNIDLGNNGHEGPDFHVQEAANRSELEDLIREHLDREDWFDDPSNGEMGHCDPQEGPIEIRVRYNRVSDEDPVTGHVDFEKEHFVTFTIEPGRFSSEGELEDLRNRNIQF